MKVHLGLSICPDFKLKGVAGKVATLIEFFKNIPNAFEHLKWIVNQTLTSVNKYYIFKTYQD